jgi:hypothetical protein
LELRPRPPTEIYVKDTIELVSAKDGAKLTFGRLAGSFECRYMSHRFSGAVEWSAYYVEPPSRFFAALRNDWKSERTWGDIDGAVSLRSKGDSLGHISIAVTLRHYEEQVSGEIVLELGQLDAIAASTREMFGFDAWNSV